MKLIWREPLVVFFAIITVATAAGFQSRPATIPDQQVLIQLERDWNAALQRRDVTFLGRVLADEYLVTTAEGQRGTRAQELVLAAAFDQQIDSSTLDEFVVKVYGNTAVVWYTERLTGPKQGRRVELTTRYTDVFVRRAGRWQCVASQGTKVAS
jgi:ketosteroid isomerase-like protein